MSKEAKPTHYLVAITVLLAISLLSFTSVYSAPTETNQTSFWKTIYCNTIGDWFNSPHCPLREDIDMVEYNTVTLVDDEPSIEVNNTDTYKTESNPPSINKITVNRDSPTTLSPTNTQTPIFDLSILNNYVTKDYLSSHTSNTNSNDYVTRDFLSRQVGAIGDSFGRSLSDLSTRLTALIPSTASITNWDSFFTTPSTRILAGTNLSWDGNTLNAVGSAGGVSLSISNNIFGQSSLTPTTTQNLAISGTGTSTFSGGLESWRQISSPYFNATSTTATSTFAGGLSVTGNVGVGTSGSGYKLSVADSSTDPFVPAFFVQRTIEGVSPNVVTTALFKNTTDVVGGSDYQNEVHLVLQAGTTANHRRYLNFREYDGTEGMIFGSSAQNNTILFHANESLHRMILYSSDQGGNSSLSSAGTGSVDLNKSASGEGEAGTGGLNVYSGGSYSGLYNLLAVNPTNLVYYNNNALNGGSRFKVTSEGQVEISTLSGNPLVIRGSTNSAIAGIDNSGRTVWGSAIGTDGINSHEFFNTVATTSSTGRSGLKVSSTLATVGDNSAIQSSLSSALTISGTHQIRGVGINNAVSYAGQHASSVMEGIISNTSYSGSGAISQLKGMSLGLSVSNAGGSVTTGYGLHIQAPSLTGTITTLYGIRLEDQGSGKYGFYSAGTANTNYFGGRVGLGTVSPASFLHILTAAIPQFRAGYDTSNYFTASTTNNGLTEFNAVGSGSAFNFLDNVGLATTSPWRTLGVTGTVGFDGLTGATGAGSICLSSTKELVYNAGSDACLPSLRSTKHDISNLSTSSLSTLNLLTPVSFIYNQGDNRTRYGFIAEDVSQIDTHLATYNDKGEISGIDDRALIALAIGSIKELDIKIRNIITSVGEWVFSKITATLGVFERVESDSIKSNIVETKTFESDSVKSNSVETKGIQMTDKLTGQVYCISLSGGNLDKSIGPCSTATTTVIISPTPTPTPDSTPSPSPDPTITPSPESSPTPEPTLTLSPAPVPDLPTPTPVPEPTPTIEPVEPASREPVSNPVTEPSS
jgi:hypothetical protein